MDIYSEIKNAVIEKIVEKMVQLTTTELMFTPIDTESRYAFSILEDQVNDALMNKDLPQEVETLWIAFKNDINIHSDLNVKGMKIGLSLSLGVNHLSLRKGHLQGELIMTKPIHIEAKNTAAKLAKGMIESRINQEIQARSGKYGIRINGNTYQVDKKISFEEMVNIPYLGERNLQDLFEVESMVYEGKTLKGIIQLTNLM